MQKAAMIDAPKPPASIAGQLSGHPVWMLPVGHAAHFKPRTAGVLGVLQGRVWLTRDVSVRTLPAEAGDHFLTPGAPLHVRAGERVVLEALRGQGHAPVALQWRAAPATGPGSRWQTAVAEPVRDMRDGLVWAAQAFGRLLAGLAGYGEFLAAGRGRVLQGLESNAP
jgi:hypothetical protein